MRELIRAVPLLIDGLKIGEIESGTYDIESGDEIQIASDGVLGLSDGTPTCSMSFNAIIPVKGMQAQVDQMILGKRYVDLLIPLNGKKHTATGRITGVNYSWDHKAGKCQGAFKFLGAPSLS